MCATWLYFLLVMVCLWTYYYIPWRLLWMRGRFLLGARARCSLRDTGDASTIAIGATGRVAASAYDKK